LPEVGATGEFGLRSQAVPDGGKPVAPSSKPSAVVCRGSNSPAKRRVKLWAFSIFMRLGVTAVSGAAGGAATSAFRAASRPVGDPARIAALGRAYVDFAWREPGVFRMMFGLTEAHCGDLDLEAVGDEAESIVSRVVAEHMGWEPASPRARLRAYALWCFVHGHCFLMLDRKRAAHAGDVDETEMLAEVGRLMLAPG
jgi:hypothetical protein